MYLSKNNKKNFFSILFKKKEFSNFEREIFENYGILIEGSPENEHTFKKHIHN